MTLDLTVIPGYDTKGPGNKRQNRQVRLQENVKLLCIQGHFQQSFLRVSTVSCFDSAWREQALALTPAGCSEPALGTSSQSQTAPRPSLLSSMGRCCCLSSAAHLDFLVSLTGGSEIPPGLRGHYHCQINLKLYTSYIYLSMSYYFDLGDVALRNFVKYFLHQSHKEKEQAEKVIKLRNQ